MGVALLAALPFWARSRARLVSAVGLLSAATTVGLQSGCASTRSEKKLASAIAPTDPFTQADRAAIAALSARLGKPLTKAERARKDYEETGLYESRATLDGDWHLQGQPLRIRATTYKGRVLSLEVHFQRGCGAVCSENLGLNLERWLYSAHRYAEGRARFQSSTFDTTQVRLEAFWARPDLTRLLLVCMPLKRKAMGRIPLSAPIGQRRSDEPARCRALPALIAPTSR